MTAAATATATVSSWIPPALPECDSYNNHVLLDLRCYITDLCNATTAWGATSRGLPIQVTFRAAPPPHVSHFCVHCPGLRFLHSAPKVVATDADLVLLRVPIVPTATATIRSWDYFLYRPRSRQLDLLPNPHPLSFCDSATALLSREDGGSYVVAALSICGPVYKSNSNMVIGWDFDLHLYRSSDSKGWITKRMSVEELVRDTVVPLPLDMDYAMLYHDTGKTVTVGGERGTVAWVDLWRGIFVCDVLQEHPVLQDIPLPVPARGNWCYLLRQGKPNYIRDVTISGRKIKYIEMEIRQPRKMKNPYSYLEWVYGNSNRTPDSCMEWECGNSNSTQGIRDGWKAKIWSMAIPVGSLIDWQPEYEVEVKDITMDASNQHCCNLLSKLSSSDTTPTLQDISMAYPTISMDDDIVYFLSRTRPRPMEKLELLIAVDLKKKILQGVAELDVQKSFILMPTFCTSEICRYLRKRTGTVEELEQTENEEVKPTCS